MNRDEYDVIRRRYRIVLWGRWDDEVNAAVEDFGERFRIWPNVMLARELTYTKMETVARRDCVYDEHGDPAPDGAFVELATFAGSDYSLDLCLEAGLPVDMFELVFDPDAEFREEDDPDEDAEARFPPPPLADERRHEPQQLALALPSLPPLCA